MSAAGTRGDSPVADWVGLVAPLCCDGSSTLAGFPDQVYGDGGSVTPGL